MTDLLFRIVSLWVISFGSKYSFVFPSKTPQNLGGQPHKVWGVDPTKFGGLTPQSHILDITML